MGFAVRLASLWLAALVFAVAPDSSFGVIPPGNAGDARSPHARDHLARWADHRYVPLHLAWERIEGVKQSEVTLSPSAEK